MVNNLLITILLFSFLPDPIYMLYKIKFVQREVKKIKEGNVPTTKVETTRGTPTLDLKNKGIDMYMDPTLGVSCLWDSASFVIDGKVVEILKGIKYLTSLSNPQDIS